MTSREEWNRWMSSWDKWKRHSDAIDLLCSWRGQLPIYIGFPYHLSIGSPPLSQPSPLFLCLISRLPPAFTFPHSSQHLRLIDTLRVMSLFNWFVLCLICLFMLHLIFVFSSPLFFSMLTHPSLCLVIFVFIRPSRNHTHIQAVNC